MKKLKLIQSEFSVSRIQKGYFRLRDFKVPRMSLQLNTDVVYACSCHRIQQEICSFGLLPEHILSEKKGLLLFSYPK